LRVCMRVSVRE
jgi:hypothetical protein